MTWRTHMIGGVQAGMILAAATGADSATAALEIGAAAIGSILPDIDQPNSKISRSDILLSLASRGLAKKTKHRREVHTVWASFLFALLAILFFSASVFASTTGLAFIIGIAVAIAIDAAGGRIGSIVGLATFFVAPRYFDLDKMSFDKNLILPLTVAIFLGCIAHLAYDSANVQGIMWLYPWKKKRYRFLKIQTTSRAEDVFAIGMFVLTMVMGLLLSPFDTQTIFNF